MLWFRYGTMMCTGRDGYTLSFGTRTTHVVNGLSSVLDSANCFPHKSGTLRSPCGTGTSYVLGKVGTPRGARQRRICGCVIFFNLEFCLNKYKFTSQGTEPCLARAPWEENLNESDYCSFRHRNGIRIACIGAAVGPRTMLQAHGRHMADRVGLRLLSPILLLWSQRGRLLQVRGLRGHGGLQKLEKEVGIFPKLVWWTAPAPGIEVP